MSVLTKEEKETVINYCQDDETAVIFTRVNKDYNLIKALSKEYPTDILIISEDEDTIEAKVPRSFIKLGLRKKREFTDEEKEAMKKRMLNARKHKSKD